MKSETSVFIPVIKRSKKIAGRIDLELDFVQQMERRLTIEREIFINYLQGKDSTQHRVNARKLGDGRLYLNFFNLVLNQNTLPQFLSLNLKS